MKTAISIPDKEFESAEKLARHLGKSRSQLYTQALRNYLEKHDDELAQAALDKVYGEDPASIDPLLKILQAKSIDREQW
jgi:metal-responsive CopG/Arc/MetJ family transcriptional regulator